MCGIMVIGWEVLRPVDKKQNRGAYCEKILEKGKKYVKKDWGAL